jgi:GalNAc-alpha-(1->4)-GalNAc-alpha-(1->3)-diNAcBac-PP-undecaprenol alpha-1,4-N-acetyl-D-galactosaminyltransferase
MKKVFFVIDTLGAGGSERVISELANYLSNKYKVFLITLNQPRYLKDFYPINSNIKRIKLRENLENKSIIFRIIKIINLYKKFYKILKKEKPDVNISFLTFSNLTNLVCTFFNKKINCIISERINPKLIKKSRIYNILSFIFYRKANFLVVQSNSIKDDLQAYNKNIRIIYNHVRHIKQIKQKRYNFINISRLDDQKNIIFLIKSFRKIINYNKNLKLNIIGEGELKKKIKKSIVNLKLEKNVKLLGSKKNIDKILSSSEFYIHTAKTEGMSNVLLEAMSAKVPCIVLKHNSQHEFLKHNNNCFIIKNIDEKNFANSIIKIRNMKKKRIQNIINSAKIYADILDINKIAKKWQLLIEKNDN